jgi:hypothetical protein
VGGVEKVHFPQSRENLGIENVQENGESRSPGILTAILFLRISRGEFFNRRAWVQPASTSRLLKNQFRLRSLLFFLPFLSLQVSGARLRECAIVIRLLVPRMGKC